MTDKPLFKDSDDQEALYAPQQLPDADDETRPGEEVPLAQPGTAPAQQGGAGGIAGTAGFVPPAGVAEITDDTADDPNASSAG